MRMCIPQIFYLVTLIRGFYEFVFSVFENKAKVQQVPERKFFFKCRDHLGLRYIVCDHMPRILNLYPSETWISTVDCL